MCKSGFIQKKAYFSMDCISFQNTSREIRIECSRYCTEYKFLKTEPYRKAATVLSQLIEKEKVTVGPYPVYNSQTVG